MPAFVQLLRPKQWTKNFLVFAAYLFTAGWADPVATQHVLLAFASVSLVSSFSYCINDVLDVAKDRVHPKKKFRPVARGAISPRAAVIIGLVSLAAGLFAAYAVSQTFFGFVAVLVAVHALYNFWLKRIALVDVMTLSLLFVLRAVLGAIAIEVKISGWLLFCTGALALMLAVGKRRQEFRVLGQDSSTRSSLSGYSDLLLNQLVGFSSALASLGYSIYALKSETATLHPGLIWTVPIVIFGVMRYLQLLFQQEQGEEPETLLFRDPLMILTLVVFVAAAIAAMLVKEVPWIALS